MRGDSPAEDSDLMKITPLGSGQEVHDHVIVVLILVPILHRECRAFLREKFVN